MSNRHEPRPRFDPRAEPDDESEGQEHASSSAMRVAEDRVTVPAALRHMTSGKRPKPPRDESEAREPLEHEENVAESGVREVSEPAVAEAPSSKRAAITVEDPRIAEVEPIIARGDWAALAKQLGPFDKSGALPPQLGLMYAIALNEAPPTDDPPDATALAIRCVASMTGVSESSALALVLAKRLLRKNPTSFRERQAPPAKTSLLIVLVTLALGSAIGWFLSSGHSIALPFLHR